MSVALVVAVADRAWFEQLRARPALDEINFWTVSSQPFAGLHPGELLLFALDGGIVGGGVFAHAGILPCSVAWEVFGLANGVASLDDWRAMLRPDEAHDDAVGCAILTQPFFFEAPIVLRRWSPDGVQLKIYDTSEPQGAQLWAAVQERLSARDAGASGFDEDVRRFGHPVLIRPRLGQGAFRLVVTDLYARRCAVTGERTLPALEAAHIRPFARGGEHRPDNGLLLRRDIHRLFDLGYVTVTPDLRFEVSPRIRGEFDGGHDYYALHGRSIAIPDDPGRQPAAAALSWHNANLFLWR